MREIKFRAWLLEDKRMINPIIAVHFDSPAIEWYEDAHDALRGCSTDCPLDQTVLMQYTGLKDKNLKEVYAGDVVKCSHGCPHRVEWVQEYGGTFLGGMPTFYLSGLNAGYSWTGAEEVIGNIYENPELLQQPTG